MAPRASPLASSRTASISASLTANGLAPTDAIPSPLIAVCIGGLGTDRASR